MYLYSDKDKTHSRPRYLVSSVENEWCFLRKFVGKQLRHNAYKVHRDDCFTIPDSGNSQSEPREGKFDRFAPETQSFVLVNPNGGAFEAPPNEGGAVELPPAQLVAPPVPEEITEPMQPDLVLRDEVEVPLQAQPPVADPPRSSGRMRRPPSHLADFDCS